MNIALTTRASAWFQDEMFLNEGDFVRFYVRYGGSSPIHEGFSLGVNKEEPMDIGVEHRQDGIIYYVEERDIWYFDKYDLLVDYDEITDGPIYEYK
ncbi:HesB/YadR/YfhF family protein [Bacillus sp. FSL K6-3431]|uniref:HesB/YadR/YfhF family protein n=1 Tax=Bacillus sp. FSL K6-3431 TaxID=2921500 RepID=UPI0030FB4323